MEPFAIGASSTAALCRQRSSSPPTTPGPPFEASPATARVIAVLLAGGWFPAPTLDARRGRLAEGFGVWDIRRKCAAQLGEHVIEVHGGLRLRRGVRRCPNGGTRAQAGHLAPARSESAENPPCGLTGGARVTRSAGNDGRGAGDGMARGGRWKGHRAWRLSACGGLRDARRFGCRAPRGQSEPVDGPGGRGGRVAGGGESFLPAMRHRQAQRAGVRDRYPLWAETRSAGLGWPKANRARPKERPLLPTPQSSAVHDTRRETWNSDDLTGYLRGAGQVAAERDDGASFGGRRNGSQASHERIDWRPRKPPVTTGLVARGRGPVIDVEDCGRMGVVTGGKSGFQASGGKEFTKHLCSAAFVTRC